MAKKVVFVINNMNVGGVEKALLGVLDRYILEGWDITVAMLKPGGGLLDQIPEGVKVRVIDGMRAALKPYNRPIITSFRYALQKHRYWIAAKLGWSYAMSKVTKTQAGFLKAVMRKIPMFSSETYDLAVAFAGPFAAIDYYIAHRIKAREKWGWVHFDVSKFYIDPGIIRSIYPSFTRINVVSEASKNSFDRLFPELSSKTVVTPNIILHDTVKRMASEPIALPDKRGRKALVTVGRISGEKGQYLAIQALKLLIDRGHTNLTWWFVGSGNDETRCRRLLKEYGIEDYVQWCGLQANPYPFMAAADLYVQPSLHEGYCITLAEAMTLGMPIVTTDFAGAADRLADYLHPHATVPATPEALAEGIEKMLG